MQLALSRALVPSFSRVDSETERAFYWRAFLESWGLCKRGGGALPKRYAWDTFHPGSNPCSIARADLPTLQRGTYSVALKSDGVRYALFLTTRPTSTPETPGPVALLIDRARNMYEVEVLAPEDYFAKGTVLEGELVWRQPDERLMHLLIFDAVCIKGESLMQRAFHERLAAATRCGRSSEELAQLSSTEELETRTAELDAIVLVHFQPALVRRAKRFVDLEHVTRVWECRAEAEHRVDGVILQDAQAAYVIGTAGDAAFKWKELHTVDLAGPRDALRANDGPLGRSLHDRRVEVIPSKIEDGEGVLAEYHVSVDDETVKLMAMRTRPDKKTANSLRVVRAKVQDAMEQISIQELGGN